MAEINDLRETCAYWKAEKQFEWRVGNFNKLPRKEGYVVESERFDFYHAEWYLQLYPYGKPDYNCPGKIKIFLSLKKEISEENHHVRYRMGIKNSDGGVVEKSNEGTFGTEAGGYSVEFIERSKLLNQENEFVDQDGTLTIYFSISSEDDMKVPPSDDLATLVGDLNDLHLGALHADVKIEVGSRSFPAHKCLLAARSSVFAAMFRHETKENSTGIVEIPDCDPSIFEHFLLFLYTGKFNDLSAGDAAALYSVAEKYDLKGLKKRCVRCMTREMSRDSVLDVLSLATKYDDSELLCTATQFYSHIAKPAIGSDLKAAK